MYKIIKVPLIFILVFQFFFIILGCSHQQITPSPNVDSYAKSVIDSENVYDEDNLSNLLGSTSFPSGIGHTNVTLGDGWVIVDMGKYHEIIDNPGPDLRIYESDRSFNPDWRDDLYQVYVSNDNNIWHSLGYGRGTKEFDLAKTKFKEARYIKIKGYAESAGRTAGPDIEAIESLHPSNKKQAKASLSIVKPNNASTTLSQKSGEQSFPAAIQLSEKWAKIRSDDIQRAVKFVMDTRNTEINNYKGLKRNKSMTLIKQFDHHLQNELKNALSSIGFVLDQEATTIYHVDVESLAFSLTENTSLSHMYAKATIRVQIKASKYQILASSKAISCKTYGRPIIHYHPDEYDRLIPKCVEELIPRAFGEPILEALFDSTDPAVFAQTSKDSKSTAVVANEKKDQPAQASIQLSDNLDLDFGNYYALVIGNNDYQFMPRLKTAVNDAQVVAEILNNKYGFKVEKLYDATRLDILKMLNRFRQMLTVNDNLLIYYAGHGWLDEAGDEGYWLPVDADKNIEANWISNSHVTTTLRAIEAKHVIVVADSCYSGKLTRGVKIKNRTSSYLTRIARKKSRTVLSSGGLEPVLDSGGKGGHSVFASAFIDVLTENDGIVDATQIFAKIRRTVILNSYQTPEYSDIRHAGHDGGDFLFVPVKPTE